MEKSQKSFEEFEDAVRTELLRRLEAGELDEDDLSRLKKEKAVDSPAGMQ